VRLKFNAPLLFKMAMPITPFYISDQNLAKPFLVLTAGNMSLIPAAISIMECNWAENATGMRILLPSQERDKVA